jgi:NAD(P)-dependent dehydrogenase (short-subunit alcohol dehydrogenase family)
MARIFIAGSSTGLGLMAAKLLIEQGHRVVLHGRNQTQKFQDQTCSQSADHALLFRRRRARATTPPRNAATKTNAAIPSVPSRR